MVVLVDFLEVGAIMRLFGEVRVGSFFVFFWRCFLMGVEKMEIRVDWAGDLLLTHDYWDCECESDYFRPAAVERCGKCGACKEEMPNSRVTEVLAFYPRLREARLVFVPW